MAGQAGWASNLRPVRKVEVNKVSVDEVFDEVTEWFYITEPDRREKLRVLLEVLDLNIFREGFRHDDVAAALYSIFSNWDEEKLRALLRKGMLDPAKFTIALTREQGGRRQAAKGLQDIFSHWDKFPAFIHRVTPELFSESFAQDPYSTGRYFSHMCEELDDDKLDELIGEEGKIRPRQLGVAFVNSQYHTYKLLQYILWHWDGFNDLIAEGEGRIKPEHFSAILTSERPEAAKAAYELLGIALSDREIFRRFQEKTTPEYFARAIAARPHEAVDKAGEIVDNFKNGTWDIDMLDRLVGPQGAKILPGFFGYSFAENPHLTTELLDYCFANWNAFDELVREGGEVSPTAFSNAFTGSSFLALYNLKQILGYRFVQHNPSAGLQFFRENSICALPPAELADTGIGAAVGSVTTRAEISSATHIEALGTAAKAIPLARASRISP